MNALKTETSFKSKAGAKSPQKTAGSKRKRSFGAEKGSSKKKKGDESGRFRIHHPSSCLTSIPDNDDEISEKSENDESDIESERSQDSDDGSCSNSSKDSENSDRDDLSERSIDENLTEEILKEKKARNKQQINEVRTRLSATRKEKKDVADGMDALKKKLARAQKSKNAFCSLKRSEVRLFYDGSLKSLTMARSTPEKYLKTTSEKV